MGREERGEGMGEDGASAAFVGGSVLMFVTNRCCVDEYTYFLSQRHPSPPLVPSVPGRIHPSFSSPRRAIE